MRCWLIHTKATVEAPRCSAAVAGDASMTAGGGGHLAPPSGSPFLSCSSCTFKVICTFGCSITVHAGRERLKIPSVTQSTFFAKFLCKLFHIFDLLKCVQVHAVHFSAVTPIRLKKENEKEKSKQSSLLYFSVRKSCFGLKIRLLKWESDFLFYFFF